MAENVQEQYAQDTIDYESAVQTVKDFECGECGGLLVVVKDEGEWQVACGPDKTHQGLREVPTASEIERSGGSVPVYVSNAIERHTPPATSLAVMAGIWQSKFPSLTPAGAYQAALFSLEVGLDPRHGEIACIEYSSSGVKVPTMMVTGKGWRTMAAREVPDLYDRAPVLQDIRKPEEKEEYDAGPDDWVSIAVGRLLGDHDSLPNRVGIGVFTRKQYEAALASTANSSRDLPSTENPQNQARRRAERHWYEENCPQAIERARQGMVNVVQQLDTEGAEAIIDVEFADLTDGTRESQQRARQSPRGADTRGQGGDRPQPGPGAISNAQRGKLLGTARDQFGWDQADVERDIGKSIDQLTKSEASEVIDKYLKANQEPTSGSMFDEPGNDGR